MPATQADKLCEIGTDGQRPLGETAHRLRAQGRLASALQTNQDPHEDAMTNPHPNEIAELISRIRDIRFPMLTWQDEHGHLLSQPMTQESIDDAGGVWFFTSTLTSLWNCIAHRPQVNLAFAKPDDSHFVSVAGSAERVVDRERIHAMWNTGAQAWFPAGPEDEHAVLIRVVPHSASYWDANDSKMVQLFAMAKAAMTGQRPDLDSQHGTIKL